MKLKQLIKEYNLELSEQEFSQYIDENKKQINTRINQRYS